MMSLMDDIIYWGTLVCAWVLLPVAMVWYGLQTALKYVDKTIENFER